MAMSNYFQGCECISRLCHRYCHHWLAKGPLGLMQQVCVWCVCVGLGAEIRDWMPGAVS